MTDDERLEALISQELPRIEAFCNSITVKVSGVAQNMGLPPVALLYVACDLLTTYLVASGASAEERAVILQRCVEQINSACKSCSPGDTTP